MMNITDIIRDKIAGSNKSIKEFCRDNNLIYTTIYSALKRGITNTTLSTIMDLCSALKLSLIIQYNNEKDNVELIVEDGFKYETEIIKKHIDEKLPIKNYKELTIEQQDTITQIVDSFVNNNKYANNAWNEIILDLKSDNKKE